ncbi:MAG: cytochrome C [Bacteroidetes bacterium OLB11]|nr:MAG: cytochrome C [Bacteroidetes bacterium OLB11]
MSKAQGSRTDKEQVDFLMNLSQQRQSQGKEIYEASCVKCHKLHSPDQFNSIDWVKIMKKMGPKAHLDEIQYNKISLYLVQNAKH